VTLTPAQRKALRTLLAPKPEPLDFVTLSRIVGLVPAQDFRGGDWREVAFGPCDIAGFDFRGADLRGSDLGDVVGFRRARFDGADLRGATLPAAEPHLRNLARWRETIPGLPAEAAPEMVTIPAGTFLMGAPDDEEGTYDDERPQRVVTVPQPFALGRCAVTFAQWDTAIAAGAKLPTVSDQDWGRDDRPVINVSWKQARMYCAWLNRRLGLKGAYRLPSEAEWEYACRAETTTPFSFGATISPEQANYDGNFTYGKGRKGEWRQQTLPVGSLPANAWGLHEMHGNVWEWVADAYGPYPDHPTDARPLEHSYIEPRVLRGGSWYNIPWLFRSAVRNRDAPGSRSNSIGFRVARTLF